MSMSLYHLPLLWVYLGPSYCPLSTTDPFGCNRIRLGPDRLSFALSFSLPLPGQFCGMRLGCAGGPAVVGSSPHLSLGALCRFPWWSFSSVPSPNFVMPLPHPPLAQHRSHSFLASTASL